MKKIFGALATGSMLLATLSPAFAFDRDYSRYRSGDSTTNTAFIESQIVTTADTGYNIQGNSVEGNQVDSLSMMTFERRRHHSSSDTEVSGNNVMTTGDAFATTNSTIVANSSDCGCVPAETETYSRHHRDQSSTSLRNTAMIGSMIQTDANTGWNMQGNYVGGSTGSGDITVGGNNTATTGDATSTSNSMIVVNSQWSM